MRCRLCQAVKPAVNKYQECEECADAVNRLASDDLSERDDAIGLMAQLRDALRARILAGERQLSEVPSQGAVYAHNMPRWRAMVDVYQSLTVGLALLAPEPPPDVDPMAQAAIHGFEWPESY